MTVTDSNGESAADFVNVLVQRVPTANAGYDQPALLNAAFTLNGSGSSDQDGTIVGYAWTQTAGAPVVLTGADTATTTFTTPVVPSVLTFQLTVTDNDGFSSSDSVTITAHDAYRAAVEIPYQYRTITGNTLNLQDNTVKTISPPFPIRFGNYPTPFSTLYISSNGNVSFETTNSTKYNKPLPTSDFTTLVAPFWSDLYPTVFKPDNVFWDVIGTAPRRELVIEWRNVYATGCDDRTTFQIVFFENIPDVVFNYADVTFYGYPGAPCDGGISATIGIQTDKNTARKYGTVRDSQALLWRVERSVVADAGPEVIVQVGAQALLDGTRSYGPDNVQLSYSWMQTSGMPVVLTGADTVTPGFVAPNSSETLTFQLTVTGENGAVGTDTVYVIVNMPPVAEAGQDIIGAPGTNANLNGYASYDSDGAIVSYQWTQTGGTPVTLHSSNGYASFIVPAQSGELLTFLLTVTDDRGSTNSDSVNVLINVPPVANAGPDQKVIKGSPITLDGTASHDPDGTIVSYAWSQTAGTLVTLSGADTATAGFTAPDTAGTFTFQLTVTDNIGVARSETVNVRVMTPPTANAGPDQTVAPSTAVKLSGTQSTDSDGNILSYKWVQTSGATVALTGATGPNASFTAPSVTDTLTFSLTVTDNDGLTATDEVNITVNVPPVANAGPDQTIITSSSVTLNGTGSYDPDGTIASYSWQQVTGTSVVLTGANTATPSFIAPNAQTALSFTLTVTDSVGTTKTDSITVYVSKQPVAAAGPDQSVITNSAVTLNGAGSYDPDGSIAKYVWTQTAGTPVILTGPSSAQPSFTAPNVSGTLTFQLTVTDNYGITAADMVNVFVNVPPTANAGPDQIVKLKSTVTLDGRGSTDSDGTITFYAWIQIYGTPLTLTGANTATPSFTAPGTEGKLTFLLTVTDNNGATTSDQVIITATKSGR